jgi:hypothetical protein
MDIESEIRELKRRVGDLEGAVNVLTGQMRSVHPELVSIRDGTNRRFDASDQMLAGITRRLDTMSTQMWSLRDDLPGMLDEALERITGDRPRGTN